ncbi:hypothetical protein B566_EDAN007236 [Ephemera danica]|nr:hypothetical protein B566_EDAN007236 [Ephemera danica]
MEYFVPRSVSEFNLAALSETSLSASTILPPSAATPPPPPPIGGARLCNTTPRHHPRPPPLPDQTRIAGVGREKMVTFEDDPPRKVVDDVFM